MESWFIGFRSKVKQDIISVADGKIKKKKKNMKYNLIKFQVYLIRSKFTHIIIYFIWFISKIWLKKKINTRIFWFNVKVNCKTYFCLFATLRENRSHSLSIEALAWNSNGKGMIENFAFRMA